MLVIDNQEHFDKVKAFAELVGAFDNFKKQLDYLAGYACHDSPKDTKCHLGYDFAPNSFRFTMMKRTNDGEYNYWFNGGLIYSGPGIPLDGSGPAYTVSLSPKKGHNWSVHT